MPISNLRAKNSTTLNCSAHVLSKATLVIRSPLCSHTLSEGAYLPVCYIRFALEEVQAALLQLLSVWLALLWGQFVLDQLGHIF